MPNLTPSPQLLASANAIAANGALSFSTRISQIQALYKQAGLTISYDDAETMVADAQGELPVTPPTTDIDGDGTAEGLDEDIVVVGTRTSQNGASAPDRADHRVRISAFRGHEIQVYGPNDRGANILTPLYATGGLMFPYTPTVAVSQDTTWQTADLEGTNYDILSFKSASSATLSVTGKFTVQNQREGLYLLAVIHFLRTVSKSYFGAQSIESFASTDNLNSTGGEPVSEVASGNLAGLPPPVLLFSGYGNMMFNDVKVVVKSHSWSYDEASDLIRIDVPAHGGVVWLPPLMTIQMTLAIQQNTDTLRNEFNLDKFRTGELLKNRGWF